MRLLKYLIPVKQNHALHFNPSLIKSAALLFGINPAKITPVRQNQVGVFYIHEFGYLKIIPENIMSSNTISQINQWHMFMHKSNKSIVPLRPSINGKLVEKILVDELQFSVKLYKKAPGIQVTSNVWNEDVMYKIGKLTGKMHRLTKSYNNYTITTHIADWNDIAEECIGSQIANIDNSVNNRYQNIKKLVSRMQINPDNYGIIHSDIHRGNIFLQTDNELSLFDFEDTCYSWFANDIANIFYNVLLNTKKSPTESLSSINNFKINFWRGYREENIIHPDELKSIPIWIAFRSLFNYFYLLKNGENNTTNPTHREYFIRNRNLAFEELEKREPELFL